MIEIIGFAVIAGLLLIGNLLLIVGISDIEKRLDRISDILEK